jgi:hypothetical protein
MSPALLPHSRYEYLRVAAEQQIGRLCYGNWSSAFGRLLKAFSELSLRESERREEDEHAANSRLCDAIELAERFQGAVNEFASYKEPDPKADRDEHKRWTAKCCQLWSHRDPQPALYTSSSGEQVRTVEKAELGAVAASYFQRPWLAHGQFEWMMFDALLYAEIVALAVDLKDRAPASEGYDWMSSVRHKGDLRAMRSEAIRRKFFLRTIGWLVSFGLPAAVIWISLKSDQRGWWYGASFAWLAINLIWAAIAGIRRLIAPSRTSQWDRGWLLWDKMRRMYIGLPRESVVSPTEIRKELDRLSNEGASWPGPAIAIVDHAIQRNPAIWILAPGSAYRE